MLQSLGRPEVHMALDVVLVRGSGQEHEGCLLLTSEVLFVVSVSEDAQQQAFPVTEIDCACHSRQSNLLVVCLQQPRVACDTEVSEDEARPKRALWRGVGGRANQPALAQHAPGTFWGIARVSGWQKGLEDPGQGCSSTGRNGPCGPWWLLRNVRKSRAPQGPFPVARLATADPIPSLSLPTPTPPVRQESPSLDGYQP